VEPEGDVDVGATEEVDEGLPLVEVEEMGLVRSSSKVPESRCCWRVASDADELGGIVPKAHMTFCSVSELAFTNYKHRWVQKWNEPRTGIVKANWGGVPEAW